MLLSRSLNHGKLDDPLAVCIARDHISRWTTVSSIHLLQPCSGICPKRLLNDNSNSKLHVQQVQGPQQLPPRAASIIHENHFYGVTPFFLYGSNKHPFIAPGIMRFTIREISERSLLPKYLLPVRLASMRRPDSKTYFHHTIRGSRSQYRD